MHVRRLCFTVILVAASLSFSFGQFKTPAPIRAYNYKTIPAPKGMVYIPGGSIIVKYGQADDDTSSLKKFSVSSFYIDKTEISNKEYREFVDWVIDSVAVTNYLKDEKYFKRGNRDSSTKFIDWKVVNRHRGVINSKSSDMQNRLAGMYDHGQVRRELYNFSFTYLKRGKEGDPKDRYVTEGVNVYPDTKVWASDFPNSQTDELVAEYFTNKAYDDYPVVGVTWKQARAFCYWRSLNTKARNNKYIKNFQLPYTLPSEAQWAYAAQGPQAAVDETNTTDSIDVPRDKKDRIMANFKQNVGDYTEDGSSYTVPVTSYAPNEFGLYNMEGNVAEWVLDAYNESAWAFVHDQNPVLLYDADSSESNFMKSKVVRGGSWKDNAKYLSPYIRDYEAQDIPHSYIGFRCVMPAPEILGKQVETRHVRYKNRMPEARPAPMAARNNNDNTNTAPAATPAITPTDNTPKTNTEEIKN